MKRIYEIGKTYGNYTLVARENYRTSSGRYSQRLKCKNNVTGQFVFLHASGLKEHVEHLEKIKENFDRGWYQMTYRNYIYKMYQTAAKKRNIPFELSFEEFNNLVSKDCVYCGKEPEIPACKRYLKSKQFTTDPDAKFNGIDRIDSSKGYTIDNCVPCCETCNKMKLDHSKEFFIEHITKIYNFNKSSTTIETTSNDGTE